MDTSMTPSDTGHGGPDDMLTTAEAAKVVGLSPRSLERYRVTGEGPLYYKLGRRVLYRRGDLVTWMRERVRRSTSDPGPRIPKKNNKRNDQPPSPRGRDAPPP